MWCRTHSPLAVNVAKLCRFASQMTVTQLTVKENFDLIRSRIKLFNLPVIRTIKKP